MEFQVRFYLPDSAADGGNHSAGPAITSNWSQSAGKLGGAATLNEPDTPAFYTSPKTLNLYFLYSSQAGRICLNEA